MCVFSTHSLVKDPPFSKLDLISCRNVLIYLDEELQDRLMRTFHYALPPGGYLFLGPPKASRATPGCSPPSTRSTASCGAANAGAALPAFQPPGGRRAAVDGSAGPPYPVKTGSTRRSRRVMEQVFPRLLRNRRQSRDSALLRRRDRRIISSRRRVRPASTCSTFCART